MPVTFAHTPPTSVGPHSASIFHAQAAPRQIKTITLMRCGAEEEKCLSLRRSSLRQYWGDRDHCAHTVYCGLWVSIAQRITMPYPYQRQISLVWVSKGHCSLVFISLLRWINGLLSRNPFIELLWGEHEAELVYIMTGLVESLTDIDPHKSRH